MTFSRILCNAALALALASTLCAHPAAEKDSASAGLLAGIIIASDTPQSTGGIIGTVIDAETRLPVENVKVEVMGTDKSGVSRKDGQYRITGIDEGIFQIRASAQGYVDEMANNVEIDKGRDHPLFFTIRKAKKHVEDPSLSIESIPIVRHNPSPAYPSQARRLRLEGTVWVKLQVGEDGNVNDAAIVNSKFTVYGKSVGRSAMSAAALRSADDLKMSALTTARHWTFQPAIAQGKAIRTWITIPFKFSLEHRRY